MRNNLTPYRYFIKIKLKCSKRRLSGKLNEIELNDVTSQKRDMVSNEYFVKMFLRSRLATLLLIFRKNQVELLKKMIK